MKALIYSIHVLYKCTVHTNRTQTSKIKHQHVVLNISIRIHQSCLSCEDIDDKIRKFELLDLNTCTELHKFINLMINSFTDHIHNTRIEMFGFISTSKYVNILTSMMAFRLCSTRTQFPPFFQLHGRNTLVHTIT